MTEPSPPPAAPSHGSPAAFSRLAGEETKALPAVRRTESLCAVCYRPIGAEVTAGDDGVWLTKECPVHGRARVMIERDPAFYAALHGRQNPAPWRAHYDVCAVNVTDRCQLSQVCPHCYHMPNDAADPGIDDIVALAQRAKAGSVMLMGAEPTVRDDLPELVSAIKAARGGRVSLCTNGLRLADPAYVDGLAAAGLDCIAFSLHTPDYLGNVALWEKKQRALAVLRDRGVPIDNIAFTVRGLEDIEAVFRAAHRWWELPAYFKLRVPQHVGWCRDEPFFLSDFIPALEALRRQWGWPVEAVSADNGAYKFTLRIAGKLWRVIRWCSVRDIDLGELDCPPYALFVPELGETNILHQIIVQEGLRLGKLRREDIAPRAEAA